MFHEWVSGGGGGGDGDVDGGSISSFSIGLCKITALHTKGKIFPWPLVILDGLILAHRTGELFALVSMRACVRACVRACIELLFLVQGVFFCLLPFHIELLLVQNSKEFKVLWRVTKWLLWHIWREKKNMIVCSCVWSSIFFVVLLRINISLNKIYVYLFLYISMLQSTGKRLKVSVFFLSLFHYEQLKLKCILRFLNIFLLLLLHFYNCWNNYFFSLR